jgi:ABC-type Fe3+/spermidine/putrescine transport system ATPase subunit
MLGDRVALMSQGRIVEIGTGRELLLAPKTQETARFFGAGQVLPCVIVGKADGREGGVEVSTPLGNLTVTQKDSDFNPDAPLLFIPEDAIHFEASDAEAVGAKDGDNARLKPFSARFTGSLFEGKGLLLKLLLDPWENSPQPLPFEVTAGRRMKAPETDSTINLWVDQSLVRFVK